MKNNSCILIISIFVIIIASKSQLYSSEDYNASFIDIKEGKIYYLLFRSRSKNPNAPLVLWLTGGPGCSSMVANYYENGPLKLDINGKPYINKYSWNTQVDLLFVDQPVGTGFSSVKRLQYTRSEDDVAEDFYEFLTKFINNFPGYKDRPFYVTGESYAGHYIPAISDYIINQKNPVVNLKAIAIGNGLVNAYDQYPAYATFAYENNVISPFTYEITKMGFSLCQLLIKYLKPFSMLPCQIPSMMITGITTSPNFNVYDIRRKCDVPPLCYNFNALNFYLADKDVRKELNVSRAWWSDCSYVVHQFLSNDWMTNLTGKVYDLVSKKLNVLVYSGDKDYICNWRGGEAWTNAMVWPGQKDFVNQKYNDWFFVNDQFQDRKSVV